MTRVIALRILTTSHAARFRVYSIRVKYVQLVRRIYLASDAVFYYILSSCPFLSLYYFFLLNQLFAPRLCVFDVFCSDLCMCSSQLFISFSHYVDVFEWWTIALEHSVSLYFFSFEASSLLQFSVHSAIDCCTSRIFLLRFLFAMKLDRRWKESKAILSRNRRARRSQASLSLTYNPPKIHTSQRTFQISSSKESESLSDSLLQKLYVLEEEKIIERKHTCNIFCSPRAFFEN